MAITNFISTIWSENLLKKLDQKYIAVSHCTRDYEGDIKEQGSKVKICGLGKINVGDYTKDTDMGTPDILSDESMTLSIDQAKYFNFQIDDIDRAQSNPKLMDEAMKAAAVALADEADKFVFGLYDKTMYQLNQEDPSPYNIVDDILDIKTHFMKIGVMDSDDVVIEVSPEVASMLLKAKIDTTNDSAYYVETGFLGNVLGCKVFVSNNIAVEGGYHKCIVRTKRAVTFAEQISEVEAYRPEKRFADAVKGLHLYGAKIVYPREFYVLNLKMSDDE